MPRCISSTSPDDRSARMYFARRPSPVTVCPSSRLTKSFGSGQRRSPRRASTRSKRAPSITGCRPRRTVSTSGSSGIGAQSFAAAHFAETDAVAERIGDGHLGLGPVAALDPRTEIAIAPGADLRMIVPHPAHADIGRRSGTGIAVMLAQMQHHRPPRHLHVKRHIRLEPVLPVERESEEVEVEFTRLLDRKDAEDRYRRGESQGHGGPGRSR